MSQMTPYCFKCGAELEPEAIYCPECGRLQRSMVVRASEPGTRPTPPPPPAPPQRPPPNQPPEPPIDYSRDWGPTSAPEPAPPPEPTQTYLPPQHAGLHDAPPGAADAPEYGDQDWRSPAPPSYGETPVDPPSYGETPVDPPSYGETPVDPPSYGEPPVGPPPEAPPADHVYAQQQYPETVYAPPHQPYERDAYVYGQEEQGYGRYDQGYGPGDPYGSPQPGPYTYTPPPYGPGRGAPGRGRGRQVAFVLAALVGLFLIGILISKVLSGPSPTAGTNTGGQGGAPGITTPPPATATPPPASTATPPPAASAASFQKVSSDIPSSCSSRQGCPVTVVLRNTGGQGGGTVTVTLNDSGGNPIATFTGPIPSTAPGATVQVNGYATGDQLSPYLRSGGLVTIASVNATSS